MDNPMRLTKYVYYLIVLLILLGCRKATLNDTVVESVVSRPEYIDSVLLHSTVKVSEMLRTNLMDEKLKQEYIHYFLLFHGEYVVRNKTEGIRNTDGSTCQSIYIADREREYTAEFQFIRKNEEWLLHNIVLPDVYYR